VPPSVTLQEAAERLGVHYMTAYRYVRTGRLPAVKDGATWRVRTEDLDAFVADRADGPPVRRSTGKRHTLAPDRLVRRLVAGDEAGAWKLVDDARAAGADEVTIYVDLLIPALATIGSSWETGAVTVADEHTASATVLRLIGRLGPAFNRPGRKRGSIVLGSVPGDPHGLPTALLADLLRGERFEVHDLGGDVPLDAWRQAVRDADRLVAVGISASSPDQDEVIARTVDTVRETRAVPIFLGGHAVHDAEHARVLGADGWAEDAVGTLALFTTSTA
jgi:excisionase family DNA binding protein